MAFSNSLVVSCIFDDGIMMKPIYGSALLDCLGWRGEGEIRAAGTLGTASSD